MLRPSLGRGCDHDQTVDLTEDLNPQQVEVETVCIRCGVVVAYDVRARPPAVP